MMDNETEFIPPDSEAECTHCSKKMSWAEAAEHLCHWVAITVYGLLPRNDVDIDSAESFIFELNEEYLRTDVSGWLGLEEVNQITLRRAGFGNAPTVDPTTEENDDGQTTEREAPEGDL